jgi:hypothetical protein
MFLCSLVAFVVKRNGMLTRLQNVLTGWGCGIGITLIVSALQYENYGGESRAPGMRMALVCPGLMME